MLLDLLGFDVVRRSQEAEPRLIREELDSEFVKLFGQICEVLEVGKRLSKLVQILVGPVYDASQMDIDALVRYGVLAKHREGFRAFADSFGEYLPLVARTIDVWPLWRETETSLRRAVEVLLDQFYGNQWENALVKARPQLAKIINDCRNEKMREKEKFGAHGSDHTLDYTYPNDLLAIMSSNWKELGKPILGQDPSAWAPKFAILAKVRNPLAHNRDFNLTYERQMAEAYCREILERVTEWNCTNETPL